MDRLAGPQLLNFWYSWRMPVSRNWSGMGVGEGVMVGVTVGVAAGPLVLWLLPRIQSPG